MKKLLLTILKTAVFLTGWAVLSGVIDGVLDISRDDPAVWRFFAELIPLAVLVGFTGIFLLLEKNQIRIPILDNLGKGTRIGTITGLIWIGVAAGVLLLSRQLTVTSTKEISTLWLWILSAFLNVLMQELLVRGYLYQLLKARYNLPAAVVVTTAFFTVMHTGAFEAGVIPVINVVTMCLFATALYESEKTLLAPVMAHAIWNIVGALFLGGVSLAEDYPHMLTLRASANTLLSGGDNTIEASVVTLILNIILLAVFYRRCRKASGKRAARR